MTAYPQAEPGTPNFRLLNDLSYTLKRPGHRLHPFLRLREDLFLDTYDLKLLVAHLESRHGRFLTEEEAEKIETIGDIQNLFLRQAA